MPTVVRNRSLWKSQQHVIALLEILTRFNNTEENPVLLRKQFLENLLALQTSDSLFENEKLQHLCHSLEEALLWNSKPGEQFPSVNKLRMLAACEEIRLYIVLRALCTSLAIETVEEEAFCELLHKGDSLPFGPINHGFGKVTHTTFRNKTIILLPPIQSVEQCHDVLSELSVIHDIAIPNDWVIDFSALRQLPDIFYATLRSYQADFRRQHRKLHLCWIPESLFSAPSMEHLKASFPTQHIGGYYFSCSV